MKRRRRWGVQRHSISSGRVGDRGYSTGQCQPVNLTLPEKVDNITLYDEAGRMVKINSSQSFWQGTTSTAWTLKGMSRKAVYNLTSQGQQFVISIRDKGPVRVILPEGYATGDRLLGIAWPPPDMIASAEKKRVLSPGIIPLRYPILR